MIFNYLFDCLIIFLFFPGCIWFLVSAYLSRLFTHHSQCSALHSSHSGLFTSWTTRLPPSPPPSPWAFAFAVLMRGFPIASSGLLNFYLSLTYVDQLHFLRNALSNPPEWHWSVWLYFHSIYQSLKVYAHVNYLIKVHMLHKTVSSKRIEMSSAYHINWTISEKLNIHGVYITFCYMSKYSQRRVTC